MVELLLQAERLCTYPKHGAGLEQVSFRVGVGELVGFFTLNPQGLSELLALLTQGKVPGAGRWVFQGQPVTSLLPGHVALIDSPHLLVPSMSVAENLLVLNQSLPLFWVNHRKIESQAYAVLDDFAITLVPHMLVNYLSHLERFLLSLLKAYLTKVSLIVLKDLGTRFKPDEMAQIVRLVQRLQGRGMSFIYISASLDALLDTTSMLMVLQDARITQTFYPGQCRASLHQQRPLQLPTLKPMTAQVRAMSLVHTPLFQRVSLPEYLHQGECLSLIHPEAKTLRELVSALFHWRSFDNIELYGTLAAKSVCFLPSHARESGLFQHCSYLFNLCFFLDRKLAQPIIPQRYLNHIEKTYGHIVGALIHAKNLLALDDEQLTVLLYQRILLLAPTLVVLHDPFVNCPPDLQHRIQKLIVSLKSRGMGVIIFSSVAVHEQVSDHTILCT